MTYSLKSVEGDGGVCGGDGLAVYHLGLFEPLVSLGQSQHLTVTLSVAKFAKVTELLP